MVEQYQLDIWVRWLRGRMKGQVEKIYKQKNNKKYTNLFSRNMYVSKYLNMIYSKNNLECK